MVLFIDLIRRFNKKGASQYIDQIINSITRLQTQSLTQELDDDLRTNAAMSMERIASSDNLSFLHKVLKEQTYLVPLEPDLNIVKLDLVFDHAGYVSDSSPPSINKVKDRSGFDRHATVMGNPCLVSSVGLLIPTGPTPLSITPLSLLMDGTDDAFYVTDSGDTDLTIRAAFSVCLIFYTEFYDNTGSFNNRLFSKSDSGGYRLMVFIGRTGLIRVQYTNGFTTFKASSTIPINLKQWYILFVTMDNSFNLKIYLDGVDVTDTSSSFGTITYNTSSTDFFIGAYEGTCGKFEGAIYRCIFYGKAVSATEVSNFQTNKLSISAIPAGQVPLAGFFSATS